MAPRGLQRSSDDRMLFGVAGGLADCFDIDPVLVRVGFVIAGLRSGIGVIAYVIPAILTPRAGASPVDAGQAARESIAGVPDEAVEVGRCRQASAPRDRQDRSLFMIGTLIVIVGYLWLFVTIGACSGSPGSLRSGSARPWRLRSLSC
ncbi:MAG: PspC domain-containing protein [SAR202 cluster bacterium]|nr:PspC domain-containing protein [SAR202 cluster bacterium]